MPRSGARSEHGATLDRVVACIRDSREPREMLALVARELRESFGAARCTFYERDPSDAARIVARVVSDDGTLPQPEARMDLAGAWLERCFSSAEPVRAARAIAAPLSAEERQAAVAIEFAEPRACDDVEIVVLRGAGMLVEFALEANRRGVLERDRQRRADNLERTTLALRDARDANDVLAIVARGLAHDFHRPCAAYEVRAGEFHLVHASEPAAAAPPLRSEGFDLDTLRVRVAVRSEARDILAVAADGQLRSVIALIGRPLGEEDVRYLRAISGHVALALSNALSFEQLRGYAAEGAALNTVARTLLGFTAVEPLAEALCKLSLRLVRAERACIYEHRDETLTLVGCAHVGGTWMPPQTLSAAEESDIDSFVRLPLGSLRAGGHGGFLVVSREEEPFGHWEMRLLEAVVSLADLALRNVDLYEQSTRANAALAESNAFKDDLMAMFAHDFKGPLTVISGLSELLLETESDHVRHSAETILRQVRRLAKLSEDALALAATQSAGFSLQRREEDFVAFVVEAVHTLDRGTGRIRLEVPDGPVVVAFDRSRLRHVLDNVVDNALKYSSDTVTVAVCERESEVELAVTDRGIGVPAEDLERIFTRFGRGQNVRANVAGAGVGLYIAKKIVEVHGGRLTVRSEENQGSTFSVTLPLA